MSKANLVAILFALTGMSVQADIQTVQGLTYEQARWHPLHFKPASETASDEQCLGLSRRGIGEERPCGITRGGQGERCVGVVRDA